MATLLALLTAPMALAGTAGPSDIQPAAVPAAMPAAPSFVDNMDKESLLMVLQRQIEDFAKHPNHAVQIGRRATTTDHMRRTLTAFAELVQAHFGTPAFASELRQRFEILNEGEAYVTGYYLPLMEARTKPEAPFTLPLYRYSADARRFSRTQIEAGALAKRGLEIAWVSDPFARYSLMVQGSGLLHFPDGRTVNINFAGSNGQPYRSLGRIFIDEGLLTDKTLSWQAIQAYLESHPEKREAYFNRNPSYCFFKLNEGGPFGLSRIPLTAGRSIATDKRHYPAGALAYLTVPEQGIARFTVDQDTGGAINGKARVDLYLGGGEAAADLAGRLKHPGHLVYLLLRETPPKRPVR